MSEELSSLAKRLIALKDQKDYFESELKQLKTDYDRLSATLVMVMNNTEVDSFKIDGRTIFTQTDLRSSIVNEELAFKYLRESGNGSIIKETVNSRTLGSFIKEKVEAAEIDISQAEALGFKIFPQESLRIRKA